MGNQSFNFAGGAGNLGGGLGGWADDGNVVRLKTVTDYVGIGTATPAQPLTVTGNVSSQSIIYDKYGNSELWFNVWSQVSSQSAGWGAGAAGGWTDDGAVVRLSTSTDNVGIGTASSPAPDKLTVYAASTGTRIRVKSDASQQTSIAFDKNNTIEGEIGVSSTADQMFFNVNGSQRMLITDAGLVGIGTSAPGTNLTVAGGISASGSATVGGSITSTDGSSDQWYSVYAVVSSNSGSWGVASTPWTDGGAAIYPTTLTDKVGIGLASTDIEQPLTVKGNISASNIIYAGNNSASADYDNSSNSEQWALSYTKVNQSSSTWDQAYSTVKATSSLWDKGGVLGISFTEVATASGLWNYVANNSGALAAYNTDQLVSTFSTDEHYSKTKLLLHFEGDDNSTYTVDDSYVHSNSLTWQGGANISNTFAKFGSTSLYLDGTGDYLESNDVTRSLSDSKIFTIECWAYITDSGETGDGTVFGFHKSNGDNITMVRYKRNRGQMIPAMLVNNASVLYGNTSYSHNQWLHIALVSDGTNTRLYINGVCELNTPTVGDISYWGGAQKFNIGQDWDSSSTSDFFMGYIDDFRITDGVVRYTGTDNSSSNFIVPTEKFSGEIKRTSVVTGISGALDVTAHGAVSDSVFSTVNTNSADWNYVAANSSTGGSSFDSSLLTTTSSNWNTAYTRWTDAGDVTHLTTGDKVSIGLTNGNEKLTVAGNISAQEVLYCDKSNSTKWASVFTNVNSNSGTWQAGGGTAAAINLTSTTKDIYTSISTDDHFKDVMLLLHCGESDDNASTRDDSARHHDSIWVGEPVISTDQKKFGDASLYFDGTDDRIIVSSSNDFGFGSSDDFTIEGWVYFTNHDNHPYIFDCRGSDPSTEVVPVLYVSYGQLKYFVNETKITDPGVLSVDTWYHVAVVRDGGTTTLYRDGVSVGDFTDSLNYAACGFTIGSKFTAGTRSVSGYMDEFRLTKGVARYTSGFTPPSVAFSGESVYQQTVVTGVTALGSAAAGAATNLTTTTEDLYTTFSTDSAYEAVEMLLHFNGSDNTDIALSAENIYDDSHNPKNIVHVGNAGLSTTQKKFGSSSLYLDGTSAGGYVAVSGPARHWLNFAKKDWCIECWIYPTQLSRNAGIINQSNGGAASDSSFAIWLDSSNNIGIYTTENTGWDNNAISTDGPISIADQWYHIAGVRSGTSLMIFVNGVLKQTTTVSSSMWIPSVADRGVEIGAQAGSNIFKGYIDEVRMTIGYPRYTGTFTVPSEAFSGQSRFVKSVVTGVTALSASIAQFNEGYIPYYNTTGREISGSTAFFDSTNKRIGVGTASPSEALTVVGSICATGNIFLSSGPVGTGGGGGGGDLSEVASSSADWNSAYTTLQSNSAITTSNEESVLITTTTDPYWNDVVLLGSWNTSDSLSGNDYSRNKHSISTISGVTAPTLSADGKFGGSIYFGGSNYLQVAGNEQFDFGSRIPWTVEFWVKTTGEGGIISHFDETSPYSGWEIRVASGKINVYLGQGSWWIGSTTVTDDAWHHIAVTFDGNQYKQWVDGTLDATIDWTTTYYSTPHSQVHLTIGADSNTSKSRYFTGWIDEIRITRGVARYTSGFTAPTTAFARPTDKLITTLTGLTGSGGGGSGGGDSHTTTTVNANSADWNYVAANSGASGGGTIASYSTKSIYTTQSDDEHYNDVVLLNHFELDDSGKVHDDSLHASDHVLTAIGSGAVVTDQARFGTSSFYMTKGTGFLFYEHHSKFNVESKDFTIECWIRPTLTSSSNGIFGGRELPTSYSPFLLLYDAEGRLWLYLSTNGTQWTHAVQSSTLIVVDDLWQHVALVRSGHNIDVYHQGVKVVGTTLNSATVALTESTGMVFGSSFGTFASGYQHAMNGWIDECRFTVGTARYTDTFTPTETAFSGEANYVDTVVTGIDSAISTNQFASYTTKDIYTSVSTDDHFKDVTLLLHCEENDDNVGTRDDSARHHDSKWSSQSVISTDQKKFGDASLYFPTAGSYINFPGSSDFSFGGDFTWEMWIRTPSTMSSAYRVAGWNTPSTDIAHQWHISSSKKLYFYYNNDSAWDLYSTTQLAANTWYHIAVSRTGSNLRLFLDGTEEASVTYSDPIGHSIYDLLLARTSQFSVEGFPGGYIDEVRITNGVGRYTSDFTPASAAFSGESIYQTTVVTGISAALDVPTSTSVYTTVMSNSAGWEAGAAGAGSIARYSTADLYTSISSDSDYHNIGALLHFEDENGSLTTADDSSNVHEVTFHGDAQISTSQYKYGTASLLLDGTGDYLSLPNHNSLDLGDGDFTIEMWIYPTALNAGGGLWGCDSGGGSNKKTFLRHFPSDPTELTFSSHHIGGSNVDITTSSAGIGTDDWYHVAVVRSTGVVKIYVDGVEKASQSLSHDFNVDAVTTIGYMGEGSNFFAGYIDEYRLTPGLARYTSAFTPPTEAFSGETRYKQTVVTSITGSVTDTDATSTYQTVSSLSANWEADALGISVSDELTNLSIGTGKTTFRMPYAMTINSIRANVNTAPTDDNLIIDINEDGSSILSSKLVIDDSERTSTTSASAAVISDTALADDAEITVDIDQVGSTSPGKGLKLWLLGYRT